MFWLPETHRGLSAAAGEHTPIRVPLDLFNFQIVTTSPNLHWLLRLIDVPKVDVLAFACDRDSLAVLPVNFDSLQLLVQVCVHQLADFFV